MFRLAKLAVYTLIAYALYEFVQGILQTETTTPTRAPRRSPAARR
jgi:hypothetical protein